MSKFIPNSFQVPNAVVDELMAELSGAELKIYLFVLRKTKGWNKEADAISVYRAIGITENDDGSYTITALQHEPQKEAIVDGSASFMPVATTAHTGGLSAIQNAEVMATDGGILLTFTQQSFIGQGLKYQVKLYRDKKLYDIYDDLPEPQLAFNDLPDGEYVAEIRAKNAAGQLSEPKKRKMRCQAFKQNKKHGQMVIRLMQIKSPQLRAVSGRQKALLATYRKRLAH